MGDEGCCYRIRKCASCLVSLLIMGVLAVLLWNFLGRPSKDEVIEGIGNFDFGDFTNVLGNMTDDIWTNTLTGNEDPFVGDNTTEAWATDGKSGLSLELQNALDDAWQAEFQEAVADWEESEVLSLTTQRVAVDHTCGRVEGVMLVCNGELLVLYYVFSVSVYII